MINVRALLGDLRRLLPQLEDDLRERCAEVSAVDAALNQEFQSAKAAGRTGDAYQEQMGPLPRVPVCRLLGSGVN